MNPEKAASIAVSGLQHLAGDPEQLSRFVALTGVEVENLREFASSPEFLAAVLDYFLGHEPTLLSFAASAGIDPSEVRKARFELSQPQESETW